MDSSWTKCKRPWMQPFVLEYLLHNPQIDCLLSVELLTLVVRPEGVADGWVAIWGPRKLRWKNYVDLLILRIPRTKETLWWETDEMGFVFLIARSMTWRHPIRILCTFICILPHGCFSE